MSPGLPREDFLIQRALCLRLLESSCLTRVIKQSNKPVSQVSKNPNRMVNQQNTRTRISFVFEKSRAFLSPILVSFYRFPRTFHFSFAYFAKQRFSVMKFCVGNLRGKFAPGRPEFIPFLMANARLFLEQRKIARGNDYRVLDLSSLENFISSPCYK